MPAFMDATCSKCGKRFGWVGKVTDRPACPNCGDRPSDESLQADEEELNDFKELLIKKAEEKRKK